VGHDGTLASFAGTAASGWQGNGTPDSPYRLQFDGSNDLVTVIAQSVAELQTPTAASAGVWFKTPSDTARTQYVLEWDSQFSSPWPGMAIAIGNGHVKARLATWVDVAPVIPNVWYNVVVTKAASGASVYVNGDLVYSAASANLGGQKSVISIGASTYKGSNHYADYFAGAIAQVRVWPSALGATEVQALYQSNVSSYQAGGTRVAMFRADSAAGGGPYSIPGNGSPWKDLVSTHDAVLTNFAGNTSSGWNGDGITEPRKLVFDGVDDRVTIGAGAIPELQSGDQATVGSG
jgi:hypothetical protein